MTGLVLASVRLPGDSEPSHLHLGDGKVVGISTGGNLPAGVRVVDLDGRYVIPGLWDEHVHMTQWALHTNRLDLSQAASAQEAVATVSASLPAADPSVTTVGVGFRDALWPDVPSLEMLDAGTGNQPTVLIGHDLHCVWLNTAAARRYSVEPDASGLLREELAFTLTRELGKLPDSVVDAWVAKAARAAAARGVVGVVDFEMTWNRDPWLRRMAGGCDTLRVDAGVYPEDLERAAGDGMCTGQEVDGGNGLLRVGPLKVLIDGSLNTRTAYCVDPYPHGGHGLLTVSEAELLALLVRAKEAGFVPAVHAIGDAANQVALNAFERAGIGGRIEHAQFVRRRDFGRFGQLGFTASVQPLHALDDRDAAESNWPGRTDRAFPLRSLLHSGQGWPWARMPRLLPWIPGPPCRPPPQGPEATAASLGIRRRPSPACRPWPRPPGAEAGSVSVIPLTLQCSTAIRWRCRTRCSQQCRSRRRCWREGLRSTAVWPGRARWPLVPDARCRRLACAEGRRMLVRTDGNGATPPEEARLYSSHP